MTDEEKIAEFINLLTDKALVWAMAVWEMIFVMKDCPPLSVSSSCYVECSNILEQKIKTTSPSSTFCRVKTMLPITS